MISRMNVRVETHFLLRYILMQEVQKSQLRHENLVCKAKMTWQVVANI